MNKVTEKETIFKRIAEGDKKAFDEFFTLYYPRLVQFAGLYLDSVAQAEDVVSEVLTNMLHQRERVFLLKNFDGYLYSSVKNKALSSIRRKRVAEAYSVHIHRDHSHCAVFPDSHDGLVAQELNELVAKIIAGFPPKRRIVFQLVRDEGMSYSEAATLLDISVRTVEVHLRLAIGELRKTVEAYLIHDAVNIMQ